MPKKIRYNGVVHNFPDDATDDEIRSVLEGSNRQAVQPQSQAVSTPLATPSSTGNRILSAIQADPNVNLVTGAVKKAVTGIPLTVSKWMGMVPSTTTAEELGMEPANALQKLGGFGEQTAEFMGPARYLPVAPQLARLPQAGRLVNAARGLVNLGSRGLLEGASAAGVAKLQGTDPTLPAAIGATSPFAGALAGRAARTLYRTQLKPSTTLSPADAAAVTETGLRERLPITRSGLEGLETTTEQLGRQADALINPQAVISPTDVVQRAATSRAPLATQVNPEAETATFDEAMREFQRQHQIPGQAAIAPGPPQPTGILDPYGNPIMRPGTPGVPAVPPQDIPIPAPRAQALKKGTYERTYARTGEQGLTSASKIGQTSLARGLKEEIAAQFPQIEPLNQRMADLFALRPELARAVNRIENRDVIPISGYFNPLALWERLPLKSRIAIELERARGIPGALAAGAVSSGRQ
jgi:hypothetical protein